MDRPIDDNGLEVLTAAQCWDLVTSTSVGRLALTRGALPVVFPVCFGVVDRTPVFRLHAGALLQAAAQRDVVCFQTDSVADGPMWSVLVTGRLGVIVDPERLALARGIPIRSWTSGGAGQFAELSSELVSGRRLRHGAASP